MNTFARFLALTMVLPNICMAASLVQSGNNFEFAFKEGNQFVADLSAEYGTKGNYLYSPDKKLDTGYSQISPRLYTQMHNEQHLIQVLAAAESYTFEHFSEDDHVDANLKAKYFFKPADDQALFFSASYQDEFIYRGTGILKGEINTLLEGDKSDTRLLNLGYRYGHIDSVSKASVLIGEKEVSFSTRQELTKVFEYKNAFVHTELDYLVSGNTYLSFLLEYEDISHQHNTAQDREVMSYLAGVSWAASDISNFKLLLGLQQLSFDAEELDDKKQFRWQLAYNWHPLPYFNANILSSRSVEESEQLFASYKIKDQIKLVLGYEVNERNDISFSTSFANEKTTFSLSEYSENNLAVSLAWQYQWRQWLSVLVKGLYEERSSNNEAYEFSNNAFSLGFKVSY